MASSREKARIVEFRFGYFPREFQWRGQRFAVTALSRVWCESRQWPRLKQYRVFEVKTSEGVFQLCHDLLHNTWSVRKWPAPAVQRVHAPAGTQGLGGRANGRGLVMVR